MNDPRTAWDQIAERAAEAAPVEILPKLAWLNNLKQMWADSRRRTNDGFDLQMKALGAKASPPSGEEMGDTIVTGDIQITQQPPTPSAGMSTLGKVGAAAALLAGGAGAAVVADKYLGNELQPPAVVAPADPQPAPNAPNFEGVFGIETK